MVKRKKKIEVPAPIHWWKQKHREMNKESRRQRSREPGGAWARRPHRGMWVQSEKQTYFLKKRSPCHLLLTHLVLPRPPGLLLDQKGHTRVHPRRPGPEAGTPRPSRLPLLLRQPFFSSKGSLPKPLLAFIWQQQMAFLHATTYTQFTYFPVF